MIKKGELTTQQIVGLIILIISFAVILFLILRLNFGEESEKELCHNSVVMRGKSFLKDVSSLNCYRTYICITKDGTCEGLNKPEVVEVKNLNEIYKKLAEEMANCWWMFGEGKINYVGEDMLPSNYCSICSQILFDDSLNDLEDVENGVISKDSLYSYLSKNKISDEETYSKYLFGIEDINLLKQSVSEKEGVETFGKIKIGEQYFLVMGITSEAGVMEWASTGVGIGAGAGLTVVGAFAIFSNPIGWVTAAVVVGGAIGSGAVAGSTVGVSVADSIEPEILAVTVSGRGIKNQFMPPTLVEIASNKFKSLNCKEILTYT